MRQVRALAPGKAVLLGEYAVTRGAPALSLAVDRRARVSLVPCQPDERGLSAPQLGVTNLAFTAEQPGHIVWNVDHPDWAAVARTANLLSLLHKLAVERFGDPGPYRVEIDTAELFASHGQDQIKLGLGSSSAVAVALDAALRCLCSRSSRSGLSMQALDRLLRPYRRDQDGRGSGIDLATSLCGGVISYQRKAQEVEVKRVSLPSDLALMLVWTGQAASTPRLLAAFDAWCEHSPEAAHSLLTQMHECCLHGQRAMEQGDGEALVGQFSAYGRLMGTMGGLMGADVVTPTLAEIAVQAAGLGIACKPSGAGGGDLALLASTHSGRLHELRLWLEEQGLFAFVPGLDDIGVRAEWCEPN
ncbi:MAG: hypothetical protein EA370_17955 [Wenzhouxiangella sp.]|nr:MAG: hypothetical protein EA370_17955 [Wenzhouxiangella sp.]